jgi:hypothetical protein
MLDAVHLQNFNESFFGGHFHDRISPQGIKSGNRCSTMIQP